MNEEMTSQRQATTTTLEGEGHQLLDRILTEGRLARDEATRDDGKKMLSGFIKQILDTDVSFNRNTSRMISERIASIDRLLSDQLNEIMHQSKFQQLEASWRNLQKMTITNEIGANLKVRVLNASPKELLTDFEKAAGFDQSNVFKMIYEREFGTLGGQPYGLLLSDLEFGRSPRDMELLQNLAQVAAAAHAPLIGSAAPDLFDLDSFTDLDRPHDLNRIFESSQMAKWRAFRASDESRFVALTVPRSLVRLPYGAGTRQIEEMDFTEDVDGSDHSKYLWGPSSWHLADRIMQSYSKYGWGAAIRGTESGGMVSNLPLHTFEADSGDTVVKCPTETTITDRREKELSDLGFIALCHARNTDYSVFFSGSTVHQPRKYVEDEANSNAKLSAMLPYIMAASRFAHYLKSMMRDKVGGFESRATIHRFLNTWISQYVTQDDSATQDVKARYPLREARVDVVEVAGRPGVYNAVVFLRPHFQLEELTASMRLVANLPTPAGS